MLSVKYAATKSSRGYLSPLLLLNTNSSSLPNPSSSSCYCYCYSLAAAAAARGATSAETSLNAKDVFRSMKEWFKLGNESWLDRVFEILNVEEEKVVAAALSQLGLRPSESLVLEVLKYGQYTKRDVLGCLKFFDWAGRQPGFFHTRATFLAIFKILSKAKLMSVTLDYLATYRKQEFVHHKDGFMGTLVVGYAVSGKPELAVQLFGQMRYKGLDLDDFSYHVLFNALVEEMRFDLADSIAKQIYIRRFESDATHSITVKSFCKQRLFEEAKEYLLRVAGEGGSGMRGHAFALASLVSALCRNRRFEKAGELIDEFSKLELVQMEPAYGMWLKELLQAGNVSEAYDFLKNKQMQEGYVPHVFRYNTLLCKLLKEDRLEEASDVLMEMMENHITPNKYTMNVALCFLCQAGMKDVALKLYNCRSEFDLSLNSMAYNYLINSLCGNGRIDEAFDVLSSFTQQFPFIGRKTFLILIDALCREGKLDKLVDLFKIALKKNFHSNDPIYRKIISVLCRKGKLRDAYLVHEALRTRNEVVARNSYSDLIYGFIKSNRVDIAVSLLVEMHTYGETPSRELFRCVIGSLCLMNNPEMQVIRLLYLLLSFYEGGCRFYNLFIEGAAHAQRPEIARTVYEMMLRKGIHPNLSSVLLLLKSYLRSGKLSDAQSFFQILRQERRIGRKLFHTMMTGLCRQNEPSLALSYFHEMRYINGKFPSLECYELLVQSLCSGKEYETVLALLMDMERDGRSVTSFIGNLLLLHSFRSNELYKVWLQSTGTEGMTFSKLPILGQLIGVCSGGLGGTNQIFNIEDVIQQCFPLDLFTYNLLLRRLCKIDVDLAGQFFNRICDKGYEPNRWTYDNMVHGFLWHGRHAEAERWLRAMRLQRMDLTEPTLRLYHRRKRETHSAI